MCCRLSDFKYTLLLCVLNMCLLQKKIAAPTAVIQHSALTTSQNIYTHTHTKERVNHASPNTVRKYLYNCDKQQLIGKCCPLFHHLYRKTGLTFFSFFFFFTIYKPNSEFSKLEWSEINEQQNKIKSQGSIVFIIFIKTGV